MRFGGVPLEETHVQYKSIVVRAFFECVSVQLIIIASFVYH